MIDDELFESVGLDSGVLQSRSMNLKFANQGALVIAGGVHALLFSTASFINFLVFIIIALDFDFLFRFL